MHYLQDIMADFAGFCEDRLAMDAVGARGEDIAPLQNALEINLIASFRELVRWRWQWDIDNPHAAFEKSVHTSASFSIDSEGPLFNSLLYFTSLEQATELVLYNTTLLMFVHFYQDITKESIAGPGLSIWPEHMRPSPTNPLILPSESQTMDEIALETCRSVDYHLQGTHASSGSFSLMFPLRMW